MKPPSKRALERERQKQEIEERKRGILEYWKQLDQQDRRKVIDLKTEVQIKARHKL